jgi:hypothetical protein
MNNQQFIMTVFGGLTLLAFAAIGIVARLGQPKNKNATAEPESHPRSVE